MINFAKKLFPIYRSLTGEGVKQTLSIIKSEIPGFKINYFNCGKKVFDWQIPPEWSVKEAYIKNEKNEKIVDFKKNNLSIVVYSQPIDRTLNKNTLEKHIFTIPSHPNWIPYITSYYKKFWGFCMKENEKRKLFKGKKFQVKILSNFNKFNEKLTKKFKKINNKRDGLYDKLKLNFENEKNLPENKSLSTKIRNTLVDVKSKPKQDLIEKEINEGIDSIEKNVKKSADSISKFNIALGGIATGGVAEIFSSFGYDANIKPVLYENLERF